MPDVIRELGAAASGAQLLSRGGRPLTQQEILELGPYYGGRLNMGDIRVHDLPLSERPTVGKVMHNRPYDVYVTPGEPRSTLVHELVHSAQGDVPNQPPIFPDAPGEVTPQAAERAAQTHGMLAYVMDDLIADAARKQGIQFPGFGTEQQAEIVENYYKLVNQDRRAPPDESPWVTEFRKKQIAAYAPFVRQFEYGGRIVPGPAGGASASWPAPRTFPQAAPPRRR